MEENDSVESHREPSTFDSVAIDRESNAEENMNARSKIEKEPASSDEDSADGSSTEQKEEQLGHKFVESSSENIAQVIYMNIV